MSHSSHFSSYLCASSHWRGGIHVVWSLEWFDLAAFITALYMLLGFAIKRHCNLLSIHLYREANVPDPPAGHKWKEVRHDNNVSWLSSWTENILGQTKYIMLNPSSKLKGEKDMQKYEMARKLKSCVDKIRQNYMSDWKSKEMRIRQRSVALYFIDKVCTSSIIVGLSGLVHLLKVMSPLSGHFSVCKMGSDCGCMQSWAEHKIHPTVKYIGQLLIANSRLMLLNMKI